MKKTIAIILILLLVPVLIQANNNPISEEEIMVKLLDDLDAKFLKGDISANQKIYDKFLNLDVLEGIGNEINKDLGLNEIERLTFDEENYRQINFYGYDIYKNQLTIILSSYYNEEDKKGETFLFISLLNREQFLNINGIIENVDYIFNKHNVDAEITTNIEGTIESEINLNEYNKRINRTIESINGSLLGTYQGDNLISYNAYTRSIDNYIILGNEKMNLNIAIRNKTDNTALIYIGTPIITGGY